MTVANTVALPAVQETTSPTRSRRSGGCHDTSGPCKPLRTGPDGFPASLPPPYYPVGVIAGTRDNPMSNKWLPIPNDGMVSVESVRLEGMTDFTTLDVNHWELRNEPDVAAQVIEFLLHGRFDSAPR